MTCETTSQAVKLFQKEADICDDAKISKSLMDRLQEDGIDNIYLTKIQIGKLQNHNVCS